MSKINARVEVEGQYYEVEFEYTGEYDSHYDKRDYTLLSVRFVDGTANLIDTLDDDFKDDILYDLEEQRQAALEEDRTYADGRY